MRYSDKSCAAFVAEAASKAPVPGGGSVAALAGALGAALGNMVGSLTVGKKKYLDVEEEIRELMDRSQQIQQNLLDLIEADMESFEPLSKLYGVHPETDEEKQAHETAMEQALYAASLVPLDIVQECGRAIELSREFAEKGSRLAVSDAACSAVLCKAAMQAASLNVYINTKSMKDRETAEALNARCAGYIAYYGGIADSVFGATSSNLMGSL